MQNLFENAKFNYSWELLKTIRLFKKEFEITVSADAYFSTEKVTDAQNESYNEFLLNEEDILHNVEKVLIKQKDDEENVLNRFIPRLLKISKNGDYALVFDDTNDFENGLVVCIRPQLEIMTTDEYL